MPAWLPGSEKDFHTEITEGHHMGDCVTPLESVPKHFSVPSVSKSFSGFGIGRGTLH